MKKAVKRVEIEHIAGQVSRLPASLATLITSRFDEKNAWRTLYS